MAARRTRRTKHRLAPYKPDRKSRHLVEENKFWNIIQVAVRWVFDQTKKMTSQEAGRDVDITISQGSRSPLSTRAGDSELAAVQQQQCPARVHRGPSADNTQATSDTVTSNVFNNSGTTLMPDSDNTDKIETMYAEGQQEGGYEKGSLKDTRETEHKRAEGHEADHSDDSLPGRSYQSSIPVVEKSRYKTAPKKSRFSGCAEDTWTPEQKKERSKRIKNSSLYHEIREHQWPIVYSPNYDISFYKLEKLHVFDSGKWGKICANLKASESMRLTDDQLVSPSFAQEDDLLVVHSDRYIRTLESSSTVATITEIPPLSILPNWLVQNKVLTPLRWQTGGTILAAKLAMERGWALNIGGGFHHCCAEMGGGFCAFADITLSLKFLFETRPDVKQAMIVDLDAHQGNGHERDFYGDDRVYILDIFNKDIYPGDSYAKGAIKKKVPISCGTGDEEYLQLVKTNLLESLTEFTPDIIIYNAGTDILEGDPLGKLNVSAKGIEKRDEIVFREARDRSIPIAMVTSGGYQKRTAEVVSESVLNLHRKHLIDGPAGQMTDYGGWSCTLL